MSHFYFLVYGDPDKAHEWRRSGPPELLADDTAALRWFERERDSRRRQVANAVQSVRAIEVLSVQRIEAPLMDMGAGEGYQPNLDHPEAKYINLIRDSDAYDKLILQPLRARIARIINAAAEDRDGMMDGLSDFAVGPTSSEGTSRFDIIKRSITHIPSGLTVRMERWGLDLTLVNLALGEGMELGTLGVPATEQEQLLQQVLTLLQPIEAKLISHEQSRNEQKETRAAEIRRRLATALATPPSQQEGPL